MKVVEIFNSIDGEGIRAGELTTFIRLYGCNLNCEYCDTRYACEAEEENLPYTEMAIEDIIAECKKYKTSNITLTGGEPLIHKDVDYLLSALSELDYNINVETNGSVDISKYYTPELVYPNNVQGDEEVGVYKQLPKYGNVWFTIDYKTNASGMSDKMFMDNFEKPYNGLIYKFVVGGEEDLQQMKDIMDNHIPHKYRNRFTVLYISPVFGKIEPKRIVEFMQENDMYSDELPIRAQLQIHKFIWPVDQRGV